MGGGGFSSNPWSKTEANERAWNNAGAGYTSGSARQERYQSSRSGGASSYADDFEEVLRKAKERAEQMRQAREQAQREYAADAERTRREYEAKRRAAWAEYETSRARSTASRVYADDLRYTSRARVAAGLGLSGLMLGSILYGLYKRHKYKRKWKSAKTGKNRYSYK